MTDSFKKVINLYKKLFKSVFVLLFIFSFHAFSEDAQRTIDISKTRPSWQSVIGGEAVAPVAETTYGFAVVSDGRMVSTCTSKGNVMWQKSVKGRPSPYFSAWGDFLYCVTDGSRLNFVNPSGVTVWSADCGFEIKANPVTGWDGRIFVQGIKNISCYGLSGTRKWSVEIPEISALPLQEFPDGSFLVFLSQMKDGKTTGLRISPFGEILEDITFAGRIIYSASCPDGVLMSFSDGSFGLCSVENDSASSKWAVHYSKATSPVQAIIPQTDTSSFLFNSGNELNVLVVSNSSGTLLRQFTAGALNLNQLKYCRSTGQGNFICDSNRAIEYSDDGTIFWEAILPAASNWNYVAYTNSNQLLLCMNNWVLNSYLMSQSVGSKSTQSGEKTKAAAEKKHYTQPSKRNQKIDGITYTITSQNRIDEIKNTYSQPDYGPSEKQMISDLQEQLQAYIEDLSNTERNNREKKSIYSTNPVYTQTVLDAAALSETDSFVTEIAELLSLEKDPELRNFLIKAAGKTGYDKDGMILKAFEAVTVNSITKKDIASASLLCDSTYEIVRFMGRPALYRQGKQILSHFLYPQFDKSIREYARDTLTKIINLEL